jgi:hypothetical protein
MKHLRIALVSSVRAAALRLLKSSAFGSHADGSDQNGEYPLALVHRGPVHRAHARGPPRLRTFSAAGSEIHGSDRIQPRVKLEYTGQLV